jgi:ubiquinone/menaquinone biosynthesis C-methylase UbiE
VRRGDLLDRLAPHWACPTGAAGWLTGRLIARFGAEANQWMVELLDVQPDDRVLDVGCGPGIAVAGAAARARRGFVAGADASGIMVRQARRRNRSAIREGRVEVRRADAARLPFADGVFTKAGSVNSLQFWPSPEGGLRELHRVLAPGGRLAVVLMARRAPAAEGTPRIDDLVALMASVGFSEVVRRRRRCGGDFHWGLVARR